MDEQSVYNFDGCIRGIKVIKLCQISVTVLTLANMSDKKRAWIYKYIHIRTNTLYLSYVHCSPYKE